MTWTWLPVVPSPSQVTAAAEATEATPGPDVLGTGGATAVMATPGGGLSAPCEHMLVPTTLNMPLHAPLSAFLRPR